MSVSRTEAFATSNEPRWVGYKADLIFSPVITFYIQKGLRVTWNRAQCNASSEKADMFKSDLDKEVRARSSIDESTHPSL